MVFRVLIKRQKGISLFHLPNGLSLSFENPHIFEGGPVYYDLKSMGRSERTPLESETGKVSVKDYQWQSSIFRGLSYHLMTRSRSCFGIFGRILRYVSSCNRRGKDFDRG